MKSTSREMKKPVKKCEEENIQAVTTDKRLSTEKVITSKKYQIVRGGNNATFPWYLNKTKHNTPFYPKIPKRWNIEPNQRNNQIDNLFSDYLRMG